MIRSLGLLDRRRLMMAALGASVVGVDRPVQAADGNKTSAKTIDLVPAPDDLQVVGEAEVVRIIDGDTVVLSTGQEVRLVGIQAPKLSLGRHSMQSWPYSAEAREALVFTFLNRNVRFGYAGNRMDRHGRGLAHLVRDDGNWLQGWMIANGHARVYSFPDNRQFVDQLLRLEIAARAARSGLWELPLYQVHSATEKVILPANFFHLIEGRITDIGISQGRYFINFGEDWKEDFTATIYPDTERRFRGEWPDWSVLTGRTVRVRGWVYFRNGSAIDITHPEQIELIG
jgi:micrococcal nuclease